MSDREKNFEEAAELISADMMKLALNPEQEVYRAPYFWNPRASDAARNLIDPTLSKMRSEIEDAGVAELLRREARAGYAVGLSTAFVWMGRTDMVSLLARASDRALEHPSEGIKR